MLTKPMKNQGKRKEEEERGDRRAEKSTKAAAGSKLYSVYE